MPTVDPRRTRYLSANQTWQTGPVVYWMYRELRVHDNWAFAYAQAKALELQQPLIVVAAARADLCLVHGTDRLKDWLIQGWQDVAVECTKLNITFVLLVGDPLTQLPQLCAATKPAGVVVDFSPLRVPLTWQQQLAQQAQYPVLQVDAHNVVPAWLASPKQEFAARTFRPKLNKLLPEFLTALPKRVNHPFELSAPLRDTVVHLNQLTAAKKLVQVAALENFWSESGLHFAVRHQPGVHAGQHVLEQFLAAGLAEYDQTRNDPGYQHAHGYSHNSELSGSGTSELSPYLHFGMVSAQRVAYEVERQQKQSSSAAAAAEAFLEELLVRRELADNYCLYQPHYDDMDGAPGWARQTLASHAADPREYLYTYQQFETAATHDLAWNAAQKQLVLTGKMHGYMRMYWAKKILEWSSSAAEALQTALSLNDVYELDGRDPNGYVGVQWAITGLHDRPWFDRPVYGSVRYMALSGLKRKFDIAAYCTAYGEML